MAQETHLITLTHGQSLVAFTLPLSQEEAFIYTDERGQEMLAVQGHVGSAEYATGFWEPGTFGLSDWEKWRWEESQQSDEFANLPRNGFVRRDLVLDFIQ